MTPEFLEVSQKIMSKPPNFTHIRIADQLDKIYTVFPDESATHDSRPEGREQLHAEREPRHRHLPRRAIWRGWKGT